MDRVAGATGGRGIALIDDRGRLLAGAGRPQEMWAVARAAFKSEERSMVCGAPAARAHIEAEEESLRLGAVGCALSERELGEAARGVARIIASTVV
jgi:hypothetical protein